MVQSELEIVVAPVELAPENPEPETNPPPELPKRRPKQLKPRATNVSELRRQQEIMDVLLANDGIMQLNTELAFHLRDHVQELSESGVQTGQGAAYLSDKKTIGRAVAALEGRGQVRLIKTVVLDPNRRGSLQQPTTVIYHPNKSQLEVQEFIATLQKPYKATQALSTPVITKEVIAFSKSAKHKVVEQKPDTVPNTVDSAAVIGPRQTFLEDRQTIAQLFGFLLGRSRRAQELYLFTLNHILSDSPSQAVISVEERIISTHYWTEDYPLGSFCAIIPTQFYVPFLEAAQGNPETLNQPLKDLDPSLRRVLKVKHAGTRVRLMEILNILYALQLLTPLEEVPEGPIVVSDAKGDQLHRRFAEIEMPTVAHANPPMFWRFNKKAPIWLLCLAKFTSQNIEVGPPFYKDLTISTVGDAVTYWSVLQKVCDRQTDFATFETSSDTQSSKPFPLSPAMLASLCHYRGWIAEYRLSRLQEEYLKGMIDVDQLTTPLNDPTPDRLVQAAFITCAPQHVICAYFAAQAAKLESARERIERKRQRAPKHDRETLQNLFAQKAQKHLQELGDKWDALVRELAGDTLSPDDEEKLSPLRGRYITVGGMVDEEKLKTLIESVLRNPVESVRKRYQRISSKTSVTLPADVNIEQVEEAMPPPDRLFRPVPQVTAPVRVASLDLSGFPPLPPLIAHQSPTSVVDIVRSMGAAPKGEVPTRKKIEGLKG